MPKKNRTQNHGKGCNMQLPGPKAQLKLNQRTNEKEGSVTYSSRSVHYIHVFTPNALKCTLPRQNLPPAAIEAQTTQFMHHSTHINLFFPNTTSNT